MDVDELAPDVGQAGDLADPAPAAQLLEARVAIGVHPAPEAREVARRVGTLPVRREAVERGRRDVAPPWALVADVGPQPRGPRLAGAGREHLHRCVVRVDRLAAQDVPADRLGQRLQQRGALAHPAGQRRAVEVDALALEDLALAVERKMVGVLRDEDVGEKTRPRAPALDRARRQRRLGERFAAPTGEAGPHQAVLILPWFGGRGQAAMRSIAAGERYPSAEWRRWVLYQPSIHPNRSRRASARVA